MTYKFERLCPKCGKKFSDLVRYDLTNPDYCLSCQKTQIAERRKKERRITNVIILVSAFLVMLVVSFASRSEAHTPNFCNIWLATYTQYHPDNKDISIKQTEFELILKKMGLYNIQEIEVALDSDDMLYAADKGIETDKILKDCDEMVNKFLEEK